MNLLHNALLAGFLVGFANGSLDRVACFVGLIAMLATVITDAVREGL